MLYDSQYHNKSNSFHYGGGRLLSGEGLNMDVFFCLLPGIWANICGVGGLGACGGGGGGGELIGSSLR